MCYVIDLDLDHDVDLDQSLVDHSIIKSTKYHKYQNNIPKIRQKVPKLFSNIINIERIINMAESIIKIFNVLLTMAESIINMAESIIKILKVL